MSEKRSKQARPKLSLQEQIEQTKQELEELRFKWRQSETCEERFNEAKDAVMFTAKTKIKLCEGTEHMVSVANEICTFFNIDIESLAWNFLTDTCLKTKELYEAIEVSLSTLLDFEDLKASEEPPVLLDMDVSRGFANIADAHLLFWYWLRYNCMRPFQEHVNRIWELVRGEGKQA